MLSVVFALFVFLLATLITEVSVGGIYGNIWCFFYLWSMHVSVSGRLDEAP